MQQETMNGTKAQVVGKLILYIKPNGELVVVTGNQHLVVTADEARGMFDFLLQFARYFEQASNNGRTGNTEPLRMEQPADNA